MICPGVAQIAVVLRPILVSKEAGGRLIESLCELMNEAL
jgi:hypothetical protein